MTKFRTSMIVNIVLVVIVIVLLMNSLIFSKRGNSQDVTAETVNPLIWLNQATATYSNYLKNSKHDYLVMAATKVAAAGGEMWEFGSISNSSSVQDLGLVLTQLAEDLNQPSNAKLVFKDVNLILKYLRSDINPNPLHLSQNSVSIFEKNAAKALDKLPHNTNLYHI